MQNSKLDENTQTVIHYLKYIYIHYIKMILSDIQFIELTKSLPVNITVFVFF